jgi:hypothetical protein
VQAVSRGSQHANHFQSPNHFEALTFSVENSKELNVQFSSNLFLVLRSEKFSIQKITAKILKFSGDRSHITLRSTVVNRVDEIQKSDSRICFFIFNSTVHTTTKKESHQETPCCPQIS